jgi:hypothetical protein
VSTLISRRVWSFGILSIAIVALGLQPLAHRDAALGATLMSKATSDGQAESLRSLAVWHAQRSDHLSIISLAMILVSAGSLIVARAAGIATLQGITLIILVAYLLVFLIRV